MVFAKFIAHGLTKVLKPWNFVNCMSNFDKNEGKMSIFFVLEYLVLL